MSALYQLPTPETSAQARLSPKTRIYDAVGASTALRERFVRSSDQIAWTHKPGPRTLNLPATAAVAELSGVFRVTLKGECVAR